MSYYGYEYFCGANVVVEVENLPILEASGIAISIGETKRPIYGYSSRHFDAVARGQVLVQGSLLINYVHHDYLFRAIELGLEGQGKLITPEGSKNKASEHLSSVLGGAELETFSNAVLDDYGSSTQIVQALKDRFWIQNVNDDILYLPNPHDSFGGLEIKVTFGERSVQNQWTGKTGYLLSDVYFTGRSQSIQIDENTIVEEYPFFARNLYGLQPKFTIMDIPLDAELGTITDEQRSAVVRVA